MGEVRRAAFYVNKGGVGKSTSAAHTAVAAVEDHDLDVVLIDLAGTQNDLATQFGIADEVADPAAPVSAVFGDDWDFIVENIDDIVSRMVYETDEGPDLIPADSGLTGADNNLASVPVEKRYLKLDRFISEQLADRYDFVILDLPGAENNISLNGIIGTGDIVAPLCPGAFELDQLARFERDLDALREDLASVLRDLDVELGLAMVIPTMISGRTKQSEAFVAEIEETYPDIVGEAVASSQNIGNLQGEGKTLFAVEDGELYPTGKRAREAYRANTTELLNRLTPR